MFFGLVKKTYELYFRMFIMKIISKISIVLITTCAMYFSSNASALPIVGVAVDDFITPNNVGSTEYRSLLGGYAIKYYIPLGNANCTYGIGGCGTVSDSGDGGGILSMNLMFTPVDMVASSLNILFEDLDLKDANDPYGFFESVQVFDGSGIAITSLITDISSSLVSGDKDTQQLLSLDLGTLTSNTYFMTLNFQAEYYTNGRNTPEYLIASINQTSIPEPSILALLGLGLLGFALARRKKSC
jgi:PEP-CTERM motif-containing protein